MFTFHFKKKQKQTFSSIFLKLILIFKTAREKVVGWYSTDNSPSRSSEGRIKPFDTEINKIISQYTPNPVYVIVNVNFNGSVGLPIESYVATEEVVEESDELPPPGSGDLNTSGVGYAKHPVAAVHFRHLPYDVDALEAESIGVEHLLRDIPDREGRLATITQRVHSKRDALEILTEKLEAIRAYLVRVAEQSVRPNHRIIENVQRILNLIPDVSESAAGLARAFAIDSNDLLSVVYMGALARSVIALHDLILNREASRMAEVKAIAAAEEKKKKKTDDNVATTSADNKDNQEQSKKESK